MFLHHATAICPGMKQEVFPEIIHCWQMLLQIYCCYLSKKRTNQFILYGLCVECTNQVCNICTVFNIFLFLHEWIFPVVYHVFAKRLNSFPADCSPGYPGQP